MNELIQKHLDLFKQESPVVSSIVWIRKNFFSRMFTSGGSLIRLRTNTYKKGAFYAPPEGTQGFDNFLSDFEVYPASVVSIVSPKQTAKVEKNELEVVLVDENFLTPSSSHYVAMYNQGPMNLEVHVGVFFRLPSPETAIDGHTLEEVQTHFSPVFWDYHGRLSNISRSRNLMSIKATNFLDNVDDYNLLAMTKENQRKRDSTDSSLDQTENTKNHAFGGASRD